ncbi:transposable element [Pseudoloma neurophilia]|uniref:Transposable element n=1 Tax=Pseudoloma neurophilia TaxID=146866 RepID=A0A0R0M4P8_9MICR|nr:transposable element [Pseudoloma neurophilia]
MLLHVLSKKLNGDLRLINDFCALNQVSFTSEYFFPGITDAFHKIKGAKVFSKLDLEKGSYQIEISALDRHKTAFTRPFGKYEFNRVPF